LHTVGDADRSRLQPRSTNVWIGINGEDDTNEAYIKRIKIKKKVANWESKHFIVLGNHWNEEVPGFSDKHVTSIWLPFGSVNFAERKENSPLDLLHTPGQVTNQQRNNA
jgi:hypothetical protein